MNTKCEFGMVEAGILRLRGSDAVDLVHRLSTNDMRPLQQPGHICSTIFPTAQGKVVDWCWALSTEDGLLLKTSEGRAPRLAEWISNYIIMEDVTVEDISKSYTHVILDGDDSMKLIGLSRRPSGDSVAEQGGAMWWAGLSAYGGRLEGLVPSASLDGLKEAAKQEANCVLLDSIQIEARRLAAGVPSPQFEFKTEVNPLELRLTATAVSWNKGCYIGQEVISRLDSYDKVARLLIGFQAQKRISEASDLKLTRDGKPLGRVTSFLNLEGGGSVGLAIVKREAACAGNAVLVSDGGPVDVTLVDCPFWNDGSA